MATDIGDLQPNDLKIRRITVFEQLVGELERMVLSRELRAGTALPSEATLAKTFGVSRSVVREALRALQRDGLLERSDNGRVLLVKEVGYETIQHTFQNFMRFASVTFRELFEALLALEPVVAARAAEWASAEDIAKLHKLLDEAASSPGDPFVGGLGFHEVLAAAAGNRLLLPALYPIHTVLDQAARELLINLPGAHERSIQAHSEILKAIEARDPSGASEWMQRHIRDFAVGYERLGKSLDECPIALFVPTPSWVPRLKRSHS